MDSLFTQNTSCSATQEQQDPLLETFKRKSRNDALTAIYLGTALILFHIFAIVIGVITASQIFRSLYFIVGVVALAGGIWEYHQAKKLTITDMQSHVEGQRFEASVAKSNITYTKVILGCLIVVGILELLAGDKESIEAAGLVKSNVREGQVWRLLTCATLHVNFLHIWMNGQALIGLGRIIESLTNRAYLALVFLPSALCGSIFSLVLMPHTTSVGASGGLMGLVGFLAVLGYRRKEMLPAGFFKSILMNICLMGVIGLVGFSIIDNAAHLGGLLGGLVCGVILISREVEVSLANASVLVKTLGVVSLFLIGVISVLSIVMILK